MEFKEREALYGALVRHAFRGQNLPASWGMACAHAESDFIPDKVNDQGGDALLGNAWGLCQMTYETAKTLGYAGQAIGLLDPVTNTSLAAQLYHRDSFKLNTRDFSKLAAAYNCGWTRVRDGKIPATTRDTYLPRILKFQQMYAHFDTEPVKT